MLKLNAILKFRGNFKIKIQKQLNFQNNLENYEFDVCLLLFVI